jgi:hypothetical protein
MCGQSRSDIHKFPNSFDPRCLVEVSSSDRFPENVEICSCRYDIHFLELHDVLQLSSYFTRFPEQLWMQKVSQSPIVTESAKQVVGLMMHVCRSHDNTHP